ncbi:FlgO family outer membrane protein [Salinimonas sediminis]|uniref:FlgO family outer membrane protein n=1 Tax=Salinimonas sediminis TaxID=2303538 RepID=UPI001474A9BC|nr:FlgO family outer membrane protein [Salinimonas sediminis]
MSTLLPFTFVPRLTFMPRRLASGLAMGLLLAGVTSGCSMLATETTQQSRKAAPAKALGNAEYETYMLANELFAGMTPTRHARYAVAGFVPADTLAHNSENQQPLMLLGHQLEQGLVTEAAKRGFTAQEFRLTNDIIMSDNSDRVLSRQIDQLSALNRVDFYITGTLVHQQGGAMVNAKIIDVRTKDVVAAATRFFPAGLFWNEEQVTTRNGRLYRTENKG